MDDRIKCKNIKILEGKREREENLQDLGLGLIPKAQSTKGNTDKLFLMKIKPFVL